MHKSEQVRTLKARDVWERQFSCVFILLLKFTRLCDYDALQIRSSLNNILKLLLYWTRNIHNFYLCKNRFNTSFRLITKTKAQRTILCTRRLMRSDDARLCHRRALISRLWRLYYFKRNYLSAYKAIQTRKARSKLVCIAFYTRLNRFRRAQLSSLFLRSFFSKEVPNVFNSEFLLLLPVGNKTIFCIDPLSYHSTVWLWSFIRGYSGPQTCGTEKPSYLLKLGCFLILFQ